MLGVAGVGSCTAAVIVDGPCGFDPPPGDYGVVRVVNDSSQSITAFDCGDATCRTGLGAKQLSPSGQWSSQFELCSGDSIGITGVGGVLAGCVVLPVGEDHPELTYRASDFANNCAAGAPIRPRLS